MKMTKRNQAILANLNEMFPDAKAELDFTNNFELLVAVVLSAQTTDIAVNKVTKELFANYDTPQKLAQARQEDIEKILNRIGLYKTKAKNIIGLSNIIVSKFNGVVPDKRTDLESLPGVGRKTANVVLSVAFNIPAIAVDTHVFRTSKRLGLAEPNDSLIEVEKKLMAAFPKEVWTKLHHQLILYGRYYCKAKNPICSESIMKDYCKHD